MKSTFPKVSIIVPVYNVEKYLHRCMDSLINQTFKDIEIIAVNDGSTDNSLNILNEYCVKDDRVRVINKNNGGLSSARNIGIDEAIGKYILFVDSDDWIDLNMINQLYTTSTVNNCDVTMCSYSREYSNKSREKIFSFDEVTIFNEVECKNLHRRIIGPIGSELANPEHNDSLVTAWGKLYKSNIIKNNNIKFVDTSVIGTEDCLFNVYVFSYVKSAVFINKPFYKYWKENNNSLTSIHKSKLKDKWLKMYSYIRNFLDAGNYDESFYNALENRICMSTLGLGLNECNKANKVSEIKKIINLKEILSNKEINNAFKHLELKYFPIHWRIFYTFNKYKMAVLSYLMLNSIEFLRTRV